jgi:hypothetical protein
MPQSAIGAARRALICQHGRCPFESDRRDDPS